MFENNPYVNFDNKAILSLRIRVPSYEIVVVCVTTGNYLIAITSPITTTYKDGAAKLVDIRYETATPPRAYIVLTRDLGLALLSSIYMCNNLGCTFEMAVESVVEKLKSRSDLCLRTLNVAGIASAKALVNYASIEPFMSTNFTESIPISFNLVEILCQQSTIVLTNSDTGEVISI